MPASRLPAPNGSDFKRLTPLFLENKKILKKIKRHLEAQRRTKQF